jgi:hypothetical protein
MVKPIPIQIRFKIQYLINQDRYYTKCSYGSIYPHPYPSVYSKNIIYYHTNCPYDSSIYTKCLCDTTLLVTGQTERQHPVEALNNFEMFDRLGANEARLGPNDELPENKIFISKSALN